MTPQDSQSWTPTLPFLVQGHFLPTTRSTSLQMRIYLYLFGMFAYNSWVVANV